MDRGLAANIPAMKCGLERSWSLGQRPRGLPVDVPIGEDSGEDLISEWHTDEVGRCLETWSWGRPEGTLGQCSTADIGTLYVSEDAQHSHTYPHIDILANYFTHPLLSVYHPDPHVADKTGS